jgi:Tfp pilus assembly protein PilF
VARHERPASPAATRQTAVVDNFELALKYQGIGNLEQAQRYYVAVLEADEFNVRARNNLAMLYASRGLVPEAIEHLRRAIQIDPAYVTARNNLGVVLKDARRLDEANAVLRDALKMAPRNVGLLVNQALIQLADNQPEQARETLIRAIGEQPTHAEANFNLAILYDEAGSYTKALEHYSRFLASAGPEHGERLSEVRRRVSAISQQVSR